MDKRRKLLIVQSGSLVLVLFLLMQCKTNQHVVAATRKIPDGKTVEFYSKKSRLTIQLYQHDSLICLKDSLLQSFQHKFMQRLGKDWYTKIMYVGVQEMVRDSSSCDGLYIYRIRVGGISARYTDGAPYQFYVIKGNDVLFFDRDDIEENKKKLEGLKGMPVYQEMMKYEQNILKNLILIK